MKEKIENKLTLILAGVVIVVLIAIGIPLCINTVQTHTSDSEIETVVSTYDEIATTEAAEPETETETQPELSISSKTVTIKSKTEKSKAKKKAVKKKKTKTSKKKLTKSKKVKKKSKKNFSYATAPKQANVSYSAQWNAGYLVAIDNPDSGYHPAHVELSDKDRDLLERLCYGEFGDGGFTGAALVAQSVKDAMNTFGYTSVKTVIKSLSYDGRTDHAAGKTIKDAVTYVFDMDKSAVQHRIIYMYDTAYVDSEFHETQNYVCTFKSTRFFDKK